MSEQTRVLCRSSLSSPCGGCGSFPPTTDALLPTPRSCLPLHRRLFFHWRIVVLVVPVIIHVTSTVHPRSVCSRQRREVFHSIPLVFLHRSRIQLSLPSSRAQSDPHSPLANPSVSSFRHSDDPHVPSSSARTPNTPYSQTGTLHVTTPFSPHKPPACASHSETSIPRHLPRFVR